MTYNDLLFFEWWQWHNMAYIPSSVGFLWSSCVPCFLTYACIYKCSFDRGDTVDGYIFYDINVYIHDNNSTATLNWINCTNTLLVIYLPADGYFVWFDAVKPRDIFTRVQFQVIHSLRREPSLVPLADFFFWDGTEPMKILFVCICSVLILIDCWDESFDW